MMRRSLVESFCIATKSSHTTMRSVPLSRDVLIISRCGLRHACFISGTLTTNRMTVVQVYVAGKHCTESIPQPDSLPPNIVELLITGISVNSGYTSKLMVRRSVVPRCLFIIKACYVAAGERRGSPQSDW